MVYVYVVPELTTTEYSVNRQNSATDIFAFAMVIYEVIFPETNVNNFVSSFKYLEALKTDWRPEVPSGFTSEGPTLISQSWCKDPMVRPSANDISKIVQETVDHFDENMSLTMKMFQEEVVGIYLLYSQKREDKIYLFIHFLVYF